MTKANFVAAPVLGLALFTALAVAEDFKPETIIALERAALDRWGKGDPEGFLETAAPDVTYFDPSTEKRVDGLAAMKELMIRVRGKIKIDRYEMLGPRVQRFGDVAILTYNLVNYRNGESIIARWNSTEVYVRRQGKWKIVQSHFSYTKPDLKQPSGQ
jgi:ketosteroid isomerase-like protein